MLTTHQGASRDMFIVGTLGRVHILQIKIGTLCLAGTLGPILGRTRLKPGFVLMCILCTFGTLRHIGHIVHIGQIGYILHIGHIVLIGHIVHIGHIVLIVHIGHTEWEAVCNVRALLASVRPLGGLEGPLLVISHT